MKRVCSSTLTALCALGYAAVGGKWLLGAVGADGGIDRFTAVCGSLWLLCAAVWLYRLIRDLKKTFKKTTDNTEEER